MNCLHGKVLLDTTSGISTRTEDYSVKATVDSKVLIEMTLNYYTISKDWVLRQIVQWLNSMTIKMMVTLRASENGQGSFSATRLWIKMIKSKEENYVGWFF